MVLGSATLREKANHLMRRMNRFPIWEGFVSLAFVLLLFGMFFDRSPVTRLTIAFEFLVIFVSLGYGLLFAFRLALLRAERLQG